MIEIARVNQFVKAKLAADATLVTLVGTRIYLNNVPEGGAYPAVVFQPMAATDLTGNGGTRVLTTCVYQVKALAKNSFASAVAIADRIDAALQAAYGAAGSDAYVPGAIREAIISPPPDRVADDQYHQLGGLYRIAVHKT